MSKDQPPAFDLSKLNFNFGGSANSGFNFGAAGPGGAPFAFDLSAVASKFNDLVGQSSGYREGLPKAVQNRIKALEYYHDKLLDIESDFEEEVRKLEIQFYDRYKPIWEKRAAIVTGKDEPTPEEIADEDDEEGAAEATKEEDKKKEEDKPAEETKAEGEPEKEVKGIPDFWLLALEHNEAFEEVIVEEDKDALKYLEDVRFEYIPEELGSFKLIFQFAEDNPYLTSNVISKSYHLRKDEETGTTICSSIDSTELVWKEGKNLIEQASGALGEPDGTFFHFFNPPDVPEGQDPSPETEQGMEVDFEMAVELRDKIIPHAVSWYTGEARALEDAEAEAAYRLMGEDDDEDDDDDDDDLGALRGGKFKKAHIVPVDDDDDDDDDDDEDEEFVPPPSAKKRAGKRGGKGGKSAGNDEKPPDCKQQ